MRTNPLFAQVRLTKYPSVAVDDIVIVDVARIGVSGQVGEELTIAKLAMPIRANTEGNHIVSYFGTNGRTNRANISVHYYLLRVGLA